MYSASLLLPFFIIQIIVLYLLSRQVVKDFFLFLHLLFKNQNIAYRIIALVFFPGTILHEMSHFFIATALFLHVHSVHIMPEWEKNQLKLGRVTYEKKDIFRSIIVGIAPFFGACFFFWFIGVFHLFPHSNTIFTFFMGYLIFTVSSNMFSSAQDLVDLGYLIPIIFIVAGIYYVSGTKILIDIPSIVWQSSINILQLINFYITIAIAIHFFLFILFRSLRFISTR